MKPLAPKQSAQISRIEPPNGEPMVQQFCHPPNIVMTIMTILFWITEIVIFVIIVATGLHDMILSYRLQKHQAWLQTLTARKRRRVNRLSFTSLLLGVVVLTASPLLAIFPNWSIFQGSDSIFVLLTSLHSAWPLGIIGLIPFTIGQVLLWYYRQASMPASQQ